MPTQSVPTVRKHSESHLSVVTLFLLIFVEGFISISVEILTIRQLIPVVGNSVIVTSLIIGVFLLFLAFGYNRGGVYRDRYTQVLQRNFCLSAILLGFGLSFIFIKVLFYGLFHYVTGNALLALIGYLLLITAPLIFVLGQTVPITTNLFRHEQHVGAISGKVLYLSTLGSFLGAVVTAAVLMNYLGVAWTVLINYFSLLGLILLLFFTSKKNWFATISVLLASVLVYWVNVHVEQQYFLQTTAYNNYHLNKSYLDAELGEGRVLEVNGSPSSYLNDKQQGFVYIEHIKHLLFDQLKLKNQRILVVGAGGFSLTAAGDQGNQVVYLDIDKAIKPVAERAFIDQIHGQFVAADARAYLMNKPQQFDVIVSDAYSNNRSIPSYLVTQEHFQAIRRSLTQQGLAIFNIIGSPLFLNRYTRRIDNTIRSVFPSCTVMPIHYQSTVQNLVYVCPKSPFDADKTIYTDNLNTVTMDFYSQ